MASYTQAPDPRSFISNPYVLPAQQIIGAIATRNAYWDQGASQLKNTYSNYLNLSLSRQDNKQQLDLLMKDVNKGLKTASQMDLSLAPNVNDAMRVFEPIVKNENIMGDHAITQHYQKEFQQAEAYKIKDGGKGYSRTNQQHLAIGMESYMNEADPSSWKKHYAQRRTYIPYHDVQAEIRDLMKNFKPSITSSTLPGKGGGLYMESKTDKSAYENQIKAYLSANLSDKARTQLGINGAVAYHNRPEMLVNDYQEFTGNKLANLEKQSESLKGIIKGTKDAELKNLYNDQLSEIQGNIDDLNREYVRLKAGDTSLVEQDFDAKAALVYSDNYVNNLARANQRLDVDISYKPDAAALKVLGESMENMRLDKSIASREKIAALNVEADFAKIRLKAELDAKAEGTLGWNDATMSSGPDDQREFTKELFEKQLAESKSGLESATKLLTDNLRTQHPDIDSWSPQKRDAFIQTWANDKHNKATPVYQNYLHNFHVYNNQKATHDAVVSEALTEAKRLYPEAFKNGGVKDYAVQVTDANGKNTRLVIKGESIQKSLMGAADEFELVNGDTTNGPQQFVKYKGQTYKIDLNQYIKLKTVRAGVDSNSVQKVRDVVAEAITKSRQIQKPDGDQFKDKNLIRMRQSFGSSLGLTGNAIGDVTVYGRDQFGTYFNLPSAIEDDKLGVSREKIKQQVEAKGGKVVTVEGRPIYFLPNKDAIAGADEFYTNPQLKPIQSYFDYKKAQSSNISTNAPSTINYDPNNIGEAFTFRMDVIQGKPIYYPIHRNSNKIIGRAGGYDSIEEADLFLRSAFPNKKAFDEGIKAY